MVPQAVLICGWREEAFMSDMLREMDHGPSALPAGSQLTLFNTSTNVEIMARVKTRNRSENQYTQCHHAMGIVVCQQACTCHAILHLQSDVKVMAKASRQPSGCMSAG